MAVRTTDSAVGAIIDITSGTDITPFIEAASAVVDDHCAPLAYGATRLELIERWLAAHFFAVYDGQIASEKADEVSQAFQYDVGKYLEFTKYGQMAIILDNLGGLAAWQAAIESGKVLPRQLFWGGKKCDE